MELIRDLRNNGVVLLAKVVTLTVLALSLYSYGTFVQSTSVAVDHGLSEVADVDVYTLIDQFTGDPDAFERFRASPERLDQLAAFVERLDDEPGIRFISAYDQPLPVADFRGEERFDVGYGTEYAVRGEYPDESGRVVRDLKSIQMNEAAFEFAGLRVGNGSLPDWNAVDYGARSVPVVLGADYEGVYDIGDTLDGSLLFRDLTFEVHGFLEPDSSMYFRGDLNHFVDDAVIVPYPADLSGLVGSEQGFAGMLAFQMLGADLAVDRNLNIDDVLARLDRLGSDTGFTDYSLTGVPTYVVQLSQVRRLVQDNLALLSAILVLLVVAAAVAVVFLNALLGERRRPIISAYWSTGRGVRSLARLFAPSWLLEHSLVLAAFVATCAVLPNQHAYPFLAVVAFLLTWLTVDGLAQRHSVLACSIDRRKATP
jgi:hypothetical protein